ncbi:protein wntless-like isoform X1 [Scylla paramamosain]|uniref:protein wntless-like isoform X1 n=1 Tax=Scylla paramamosain TaxID=85552 RepID=UPI003082A732
MPNTSPQRTSTCVFVCLWATAVLTVVLVVLLGGEIAPTPWTHITVQGTKCVSEPVQGWFFPAGKHGCITAIDSTNHRNRKLKEIASHPDNIHYSFQVPPVDAGGGFSRWQRRLYAVLRLRLLHIDGYFSGHSSRVTLKTSLGYTTAGELYRPSLIASSYQERKLSCNSVKRHVFRGQTFDCSPQVLAVLFSLHHDRYLLNLLIPTRREDTNEFTNRNLGRVTDVYVTFFSQAVWYMRVLMALQVLFFPVVAVLLWKFRRSVAALERPPNHLECVLALLAMALLTMNCPVEVASLVVECPWLVVVNDVRKNFFYASFMTFFLYLTDKHLEPGRVCPHAKRAINLSIRSGTLAIIIVDMTEHIVSIQNPLAATYEPMHLSMSMLMYAMLACYLCCISVRTCAALDAIRRKGVAQEEETRCQEAMVLVLTWVVFCLSAADFVLKRLHDGMWMWEYSLGELEIENTGGFLLGVFCMWNTYTCVLLVVYSPLKKAPEPRGQSVARGLGQVRPGQYRGLEGRFLMPIDSPAVRIDMTRVVGVPLRARQSPSFVDLRVTTL